MGRRTITVEDKQYYLPAKTKEHKRPSTDKIPVELLAPEKPNAGGMKTVVISILGGRNLSPIDFHIFHRNSLDPYVKTFFKDSTCRTETRKRDVNPVFESGRMNLGPLDPNDTHVIEIQV